MQNQKRKISKFWQETLEKASFLAKKVLLTVLLDLEDPFSIDKSVTFPSTAVLSGLNIRREEFMKHLKELADLGLDVLLLNCKKKGITQDEKVKYLEFTWSFKIKEQFKKAPNKEIYFLFDSNFVTDSVKLLKESKVPQKSNNSFFSLLLTFEMWNMNHFEIHVKKLAKIAQLNRLIKGRQKAQIKETLFQWLEKLKIAKIIIDWQYDELTEKFSIIKKETKTSKNKAKLELVKSTNILQFPNIRTLN